MIIENNPKQLAAMEEFHKGNRAEGLRLQEEFAAQFREEYKENTLLLEEKARTCRSGAVTRLVQAQLDYRHKMGDGMKKQLIKDIHSQDSSPREDEKEADMLYAEFAMDFATLAMQQALISALTALDSQKSPESESGAAEGYERYID